VNPDELVAAYGSPLYVYDLDRLRAARRDLRSTLPEPFDIFYSLKANPHPQIVRALRTGAGACRAEVCSLGELHAALEAGHPAGRILYGGPGKTAAELAVACAQGVREFSVESLGDLRRVGEVATGQGITVDCLLRINSDSSAATTSIRMTGTPSQFGIDAETLPEVMPRLRTVPGTRIVGLHFYPLSNARDEDSLIAEFRQSIATAARIEADHDLPLRFLDIGGGFAAPYTVPGERPVYRKVRAELEDALDLHFPRWRSGTPQLAVESGRYLAGDCGELLSTVTNVKTSRGRTFVVLDAGINTLGGMAGLGRLLPLSVTVRRPDTDGYEKATLAGPLCTPGDLLGRDVTVPAGLAPGDIVRVPNIGGYGLSASLVTFLSRPAPVEVFVSGGEVVAATRLETSRVPVHG
jgi:diaminopimelate decarboxylase